ncbi:VENN motif pre-toxin domain-containing protein [Cronobacter dublinensis]|uniref:VENN motif pre-toxin domain-containing protein n=1 Tax=Cronobacter dublinensis TaxID=413497 RepID=UPI0023DD39B2|nr:VENN motif pre-toxin domain-containing protein [Cronobacter dublinensis]MDT3664623.1 VENN motif pre-toxin domain-containing protein [Cronobacter dublinensis]WEP43686.1 VENN motif pre-toxin domain-containing protein [Cronobacter dublinensis]
MGYLIAKEAYKKDPSQMDEIEKQTVAALSTLASGLAGALAGNSMEAVATAAKAGQTTVENNALGSVLAAANKQKPGTTENYQAGTQEASREACNGGTPVSCQLAVAAMGTIISPWILPEAVATSGAIAAGAVSAIDYGLTGSVDPKYVIALTGLEF